MRAGRTISTSRRAVWTFGVSIAVHAIALVWAALTFAAKPPTSNDTPLPIDIITIGEFTELTAGSKTALKEAPPIADSVGERKPVDDPSAAVAKTEVHAATDVQETEKQKQPAPDKKKSEPERDLIAETIKKDLAKSEPKKAEQKSEQKKPDTKAEKKVEAKAEAKTPAKKEQPKFDPRKVEDLLNKQTPQRVAATGNVVNSAVGLGVPNASSNQLSASEIDAFRRRIHNCWNPPPGAASAKRFLVPVTIRLKMDRTIDGNPKVEMTATDPITRAVIESTVRALLQCQPYTMFSLPRYDIWKELTIDFDPWAGFDG
jgi:outer membrane biosynthesis protein TonB